ncbi:MAG TPA: NosD domain-containing protein [Candidatus Thermoplasmatota archaeon]|nr:NosD domain-containing protein [Candidatus Thermoplasmatota archaeon]
MIRKCLAFGIILLFVGTCITPGIAQNTEKQSSRGNWLYVGGSGPGNYSIIQDAINDSSDGDTVFVYDKSSPYYEHLKITHQVNLIGENRETTIIDGNGNMNISVVLLADDGRNVTISGFTIRNGLRGIKVNTNNNIISGNIIDNTSQGICLSGSDSNTVAGNIITHTMFGVYISCSFQNKIYENYIEDNLLGIEVYCDWSREYVKNTLFFVEGFPNDIYKNTIRNNSYGIYVLGESLVNISHNDIINNSNGINLEISSSAGSLWCNNNTIFQNNISRNEHGITLYSRGYMRVTGGTGGWGIRDNNIVENNITYNANGIEITNYMRHGIGFNTFSHNNFIGNTQTVNLENTIYNHWVGNYWETPRLLPYPIIGEIMIFRHIIHWINFDWHPAQELYNIPGMS